MVSVSCKERAVDGRGDIGDPLVDRFDRLRGAVGHRRGEDGEA